MGSRATHKKRRQELRKKLRSVGLSEEKIERIIDEKRAEQQRRRDAASEERVRREAVYEETWARINPSDSGYRPGGHDSTLTGHGRAVGQAADAVRRGRTLTDYEYEQRDRSREATR